MHNIWISVIRIIWCDQMVFNT